MLEEQSLIPNFTPYSTPNPNPNPNSLSFHTDASHQPFLQQFEGFQDRSAFELSGTVTQTPDSTTYHNVGVTMSGSTNVVLVTRQPESALPFHCEVCKISCNAKDVLEKHKQGKKHLKSVEKLADSSANAPNLVPPSVASGTAVGELEYKKHKLLKNGATAENLISCDICNVICNNQEAFQMHVASKKHSAKAIVQLASTNAVFDATSDSSAGLQKKSNPFHCEICQITCTSSEHLKMHIAGKKHSQKVTDLEKITNLLLTPIASQDTPPPTNPMVNPESNEGKTVSLHEAKHACELCGVGCDTNEVLQNHLKGKKHLKKMKDSGQIPNIPQNPIASQDTPTTMPVVNPESNEVITVNLHEAKAVCELCGITCDTNQMLKIHMTGRKHRKNVEKSEKLIGPNPAPVTEPVAKPGVIGPLPEEVTAASDGSKRKAKRSDSGDDMEAKKQKILQSGTALNAVVTCTLCNVVCNSETVYFSHLAGQKHAAMAVKQAETQAKATVQES
ncbi:hypothetical protein QVD17_38953 [Tagetes erecta]|uniref:C2H2-type domain-containing protein n=1 Tax=Tagetes erecta TaxID=13708 RepID=A0AAD8JPT6_TARER|nr:hypothetical protein QVD17_38953 [Tagetes erecta]